MYPMMIPFKIPYEEKLGRDHLQKIYFRNLDIRDKTDPANNEYTLNSSINFYQNYLDWFSLTFKLSDS